MTRYRIPGRVELVGKHVDYAGGRSLTCAVDLALHVTSSARSDGMICITSVPHGETVQWQVGHPVAVSTGHWSLYPAAVVRRLQRDFPHMQGGIELRIDSDLPASAGLSSSSALIIAVAWALVDASGLVTDERWQRLVPDRLAFAEYCAAMESGTAFGPTPGDAGVGVRGGAQDHVAILCASAGQIGQFRYLPARAERSVAWPGDACLVIAVSGVEATKTGNAQAAYNALSDALRQARGLPRADGATLVTIDPQRLAARLEQFQTESEEIVPACADALAQGDLRRFGDLVDRSQALAETVLGNQVPETVWLQRYARAHGASAASAFGAGFGGAVWAMVPIGQAPAFASAWLAAYGRHFVQHADRAAVHVVRPAAAAERYPA